MNLDELKACDPIVLSYRKGPIQPITRAPAVVERVTPKQVHVRYRAGGGSIQRRRFWKKDGQEVGHSDFGVTRNPYYIDERLPNESFSNDVI